MVQRGENESWEERRRRQRSGRRGDAFALRWVKGEKIPSKTSTREHTASACRRAGIRAGREEKRRTGALRTCFLWARGDVCVCVSKRQRVKDQGPKKSCSSTFLVRGTGGVVRVPFNSERAARRCGRIPENKIALVFFR